MIKSTAHYRKRASARMVRDLPVDLAEMERDQPLLVLGKVREIVAREQVYDAGKPPPARRAHFGVPAAPSSSRPRSVAGEQTIHFALDNKPRRTARGFDKYATARVEQLEADLAAQASPRTDARSPAAFDRYARGHGAGEDEAPALVTTLDPDPAVRGRQWDRVEAHELAKRQNHAPGPPRLNIRFELAPELMLDVARRNDCPAGLRDVIIGERDRVAAKRTLSKHREATGVPWVDDAAPTAMEMIAAMPAFEPWRGDSGKRAGTRPRSSCRMVAAFSRSCRASSSFPPSWIARRGTGSWSG